MNPVRDIPASVWLARGLRYRTLCDAIDRWLADTRPDLAAGDDEAAARALQERQWTR